MEERLRVEEGVLKFSLSTWVIETMLYFCSCKHTHTMGVTYDNENQMFVFDFEHDGKEDIVNLTGDGYQVEAFCNSF